jgi:coatomer protein complex subunit epsilon
MTKDALLTRSMALLVQLLLSLDRRDLAQSTFAAAKRVGNDSTLVQAMEAWIGLKTVSLCARARTGSGRREACGVWRMAWPAGAAGQWSAWAILRARSGMRAMKPASMRAFGNPCALVSA